MSLFQEESKTYELPNGKELKCPICSNDFFYKRTAQLNKASSTFFGFDWADRSAVCLVCTECTHICWFLGDAE